MERNKNLPPYLPPRRALPPPAQHPRNHTPPTPPPRNIERHPQLRSRPYWHDKELPPIPRFEEIGSLSPSPTRKGAQRLTLGVVVERDSPTRGMLEVGGITSVADPAVDSLTYSTLSMARTSIDITLPASSAPALTSRSYRASRFREDFDPEPEELEFFEKIGISKRLSNQRFTPREATVYTKRASKKAPSMPPAPIRRIGDISTTGNLTTKVFEKIEDTNHLSNQRYTPRENFIHAKGLLKEALRIPPAPTGKVRGIPPTKNSPIDNSLSSKLDTKLLASPFRDMKHWLWHAKATSGSGALNIDSNWDNAMKEFENVNVTDKKISAIISGYDNPATRNRHKANGPEMRGVESETSSLHLGIDLHNAPMVIRHLELETEEMRESLFEDRDSALDSSGDKVVDPVDGETEQIDDDDGGALFDCAAALNGEMTFFLSDSEEEEEEEAVVGSHSSGEIVHTTGIEGGFF